jgi:hypothetical protein
MFYQVRSHSWRYLGQTARILAVMNQSRCTCVSVGIAALCFANNFKLYLKNFEIHSVKIQ